MPPLPPRELSRRHLLASTAAIAWGTLACTASGQEMSIRDLQDREPMDLDVLSLTNLRRPGDDQPITITVRGRRILSVGDSVPDGAEALDMDGGYVIPGFIDSHVHMQFSTPEDVLAGGVTTVRDLGGPPDAAQSLIGRTPLKVVIAGRILTPVAGYPTQSWGTDGTAREVDGVADAAVAVQEQVLAGARIIKVALEDGGGQPMFDAPTLEAIVDQARAADLRVTAHCGSAEALALAIATGVRELCHLPLHAVTPTEMEAAAAAAMVLVPTLEIRDRDDGALEALAAFRAAGGEVLYGSDLGNGGTEPGIEVTEVKMMLAAGMTPAEVLRSATADPALYLQLDTGRLEPDLLADIVVLGGDPFADPEAYDDIRLVMASGSVVG